jgi:hypothetical protein
MPIIPKRDEGLREKNWREAPASNGRGNRCFLYPNAVRPHAPRHFISTKHTAHRDRRPGTDECQKISARSADTYLRVHGLGLCPLATTELHSASGAVGCEIRCRVLTDNGDARNCSLLVRPSPSTSDGFAASCGRALHRDCGGPLAIVQACHWRTALQPSCYGRQSSDDTKNSAIRGIASNFLTPQELTS